MKTGPNKQHSDKSAQARLKTSRFAGASANPSVRIIDRIKRRFSRNPTDPRSTTTRTRAAASASLKYELNAEFVSFKRRDWFKFEMFVKFIRIIRFLDFLVNNLRNNVIMFILSRSRSKWFGYGRLYFEASSSTSFIYILLSD